MIAHVVLHDPNNEHDPTVIGVVHRPTVNQGQPFHVGYMLLDRKTLASLGYTLPTTGHHSWLRDLVLDIFHIDVDPGPALYSDYVIMLGEHSRTLYNDTHLIVENFVLGPANEVQRPKPPAEDPLQDLLAWTQDRSASRGPNGCTECEDTGCTPESPLCLAMAMTGKLQDLGL
jgi:hypothetical protein